MINALEIEKECFIEECRKYELTISELKKAAIPVGPLNFSMFDFEKMNAFSIEIENRDDATRTLIGYLNPTDHVIREWVFYWGEYHNKADHQRLVADFNAHMNKVSLTK